MEVGSAPGQSNPSQQSMSSMYFDGGTGLHSFKNKR